MERLLALSAKVPALLILTISAIVATAGEYSAKRWSMQPTWTPFLLAILLYALTGTLFMLSLSSEKLLVAGMIFDILTQSSFLILGFFVFHERLTKLQLVGAAFGVMSLITFIIAEATDP
jgi:drug/metabolite transporter (DMT)-like permease